MVIQNSYGVFCRMPFFVFVAVGRAVTRPPPGRVRKWRLDLGVVAHYLSVSYESASTPTPYLVSIPCHLEPDMRFSLTRSGAHRQPSSWSIQDIHCLDFFCTCHIRSSRFMSVSWLSKYSLRWSSCDLSCGGFGLSACTVTYFLAELG
jgi:hypothetical protein